MSPTVQYGECCRCVSIAARVWYLFTVKPNDVQIYYYAVYLPNSLTYMTLCRGEAPYAILYPRTKLTLSLYLVACRKCACPL